ncbi:unnamed protein product [Pieris brassicae]|uniref:Roadblock/LAMTOR2 domain-containing protein n=1 Tax=Pieris brassicae TaxID=7116 RepID=A0A9P0X8W3_PIEBR|nr:unnamed protein product [Pieris brassicae]
MSHTVKRKLPDIEMPAEFSTHTIGAINRIEERPNVMGIMYFRNGFLQLTTVPETLSHILTSKLPPMTSAFRRAISEIDVLDELLAFRIETNSMEIIVTGNTKNQAMKIISNLLKNFHDEWLVRTTASLNEINPIVDRIMEDESVEGVIMTNQEGEPILTNINLMNATNYGIAMRRLGAITQASIKDLDPFDEVLILRVTTKKLEIMTAPHSEFNVIVMQHSRIKSKHKNK